MNIVEMGNYQTKQPVKKPLTDAEIIQKLNKLFEKEYSSSESTISVSLDMSKSFNGGTKVYPRYNNYDALSQEAERLIAQYKQNAVPQNGGALPQVGGQQDADTLSMDSDSATSENNMSELQRNAIISATSIIPVQAGGNCTMPPTEPPMVPSVYTGTGGCACSESLDMSQTGGCGCAAPPIMVGGEKVDSASSKTSEIDVMPLFSSSTMTEYYNDMQKKHRFT